MNQAWQTALYQVTALTFEELCFMFIEPVEEPETSLEPASMAVTVSFSGPFNGALWMHLYGDLPPMLAANMLGDEEPPTVSQQHDALGEVANVICGNLLPKIAGTQAIFRLGAPQVVLHPDLAAPLSTPVVAATHIALEEGVVGLRLCIDNALAVPYVEEQCT